MATLITLLVPVVPLFWLLLLPTGQPLSHDGHILLAMKQALGDPKHALRSWSASSDSPCGWAGVICDRDHHASGTDSLVTGLSFPLFSLSGPVPTLMCGIPTLRSVDFYYNDFGGSFPDALLDSCAQLTTLNLSSNWLVGPLPQRIDRLPSLQVLDLSSNNFTGAIPESFSRLPSLRKLALNGNSLNVGPCVPPFLGQLRQLEYLALAWNSFPPSPLPRELGNLTRLTYLWLTGSSFTGHIPPTLSSLTRLQTLDFALNSLTGPIPDYITNFRSLEALQLWNNSFVGPIPADIGMLSALTTLDLSFNHLSGSLPSSFSSLKSLVSLKLQNNHLLTGNLPPGFGQLPLKELSIPGNSFTGEFPPEFGSYSSLTAFDVTHNNFSGALPPHLCSKGALLFVSTLNNNFEGRIPAAYGGCHSLLRLRLGFNRLTGTVPPSLWSLPALNILDLENNLLQGNVPSTIGMASNLSSLYLQNNAFTGSLPIEIQNLRNLSQFLASNNKLTGNIPSSIGDLISLTDLQLQSNAITGDIPAELGNCTRLSNLDLSHNQLTGSIPSTLGRLLGLNSLDLSMNHLSGSIPPSLGNLRVSVFNVSQNNLQGPIPAGLLGSQGLSTGFEGNPGLCSAAARSFPGLKPCSVPRTDHYLMVIVITSMFAAIFLLLVLTSILLYRLCYGPYNNAATAPSEPLWIHFQKLDFEPWEIMKWTPLQGKGNLIGTGAFGNVYKATLTNGQTVAIKHLRCFNHKRQDGACGVEAADKKHDGGFKAEIKTLQRARHNNIVKLLCCYSNHSDTSLLVYEYMENGSLKAALCGERSATCVRLDPARRYAIAVGAAQGLAYLHHDCNPPIVHRDFKSDNVLLDSAYQAHVADFGVARILNNLQVPFTTNVAGTPGYIAPEHCHNIRRVTEKSDVYSFGVVLLELVTGKPALIDHDPELESAEGAEFGPEQIVKWVHKRLQCVERVAVDDLLRREVFDPRLSSSCSSSVGANKMVNLLRVALHCTQNLPRQRPTMQEVVKMLTETKPTHPQISNGPNSIYGAIVVPF